MVSTTQTEAYVDAAALSAVAQLLRRYGASDVFVFGSATKSTFRPGSDVDIAVTGLPPDVFFSAIAKASDILGKPVDLVDLDDRTPRVRYLIGSGELVRVI